MTTVFIILIVAASAILGLIVLVQNPKGGGLAGNIGGFSNQLMGVKQTTDVLEKGTWIFGAVVGLLCLFSVFFLSGGSTTTDSGALDAKTPAKAAPIQGTVPVNTPAGAPAAPANLPK